MEESFQKVSDSLVSRKYLLTEAFYLELLAHEKRKEALKSTFDFDISSLQTELLSIYDEYKKYEDLLNNLFKQYELEYNTSFPLDVPYSFYVSYSIHGFTLKDICDVLFSLSKKISDILSLLNRVCTTMGHNFKYVRTDEIFDFESLECTFEEHDIYYCSCCGKLNLLDVSREVKNGISESDAKRLREVRFLASFAPFNLPFSLVDVPSDIKEINR